MSALLEVDGARKAFGGIVAVDGLSFTVAASEFVSIIGPNGAGKTSAFNVITGAYRLDSGDVRLATTSLRERSLSEIARLGIARTFQTLQVFGAMTVLENVAIPIEARHPAKGTAARAMEFLRLLGLEHRAQERASSLSFGEQRMLELARALAAEPSVLLLDEPTSGLSHAETEAFVAVLATVRVRGLAIVMIEHDIRTVMSVSDRVIVMNRGAKIAEGTPSEISVDPVVIEAYLGEAPEAFVPRAQHAGTVLLEVRALGAKRGNVRALHGVDLDVRDGEILAIVGPSGAGKSTLLGTLAGLYPRSGGTISFRGSPMRDLGAEGVVAAGIGLVPERRQMFESLSVEQNLMLGGYVRGNVPPAKLERIFSLFPRLRERRKQPAGTLSGGEQQMVAVGRGLLSEPRILMLDEPSLGLAPMVVAEIFAALREINAAGTTVVIVEQNARAAFTVANRVALLERGTIVFCAGAAEAASDPRVAEVYLGSA